MSGSVTDRYREFYRRLDKVRAADRATEKLDKFMDAYALFAEIHEEIGLHVPTVNGERLSEQALRDKVTTDELGTEWDAEEFERQAQMMEDKIRELERLTE